MDLKAIIFEDLTRTAAFVGLYFILFLLAKWMKDFFTPYKINDELTQKDNLDSVVTRFAPIMRCILFARQQGMKRSFLRSVLLLRAIA